MKTGLTILALWMLSVSAAWAVTGVNPSGVNVNASGVTSVFLTFQNLDPNETALESFWCGELIAPLPPNHVFNFNPCNPATLFGRLPQRLDRSTVSGVQGRRNLTDIMTIPASVTRRALSSAQTGGNSQFFYVRRFSSGAFVVVTCRLSAGGARTPLSLTEVRMGFLNEVGELLRDPVLPVAQGDSLPEFGAFIRYNGAGRLRGRWELVLPGDPAPTELDLLTAATLPAEQRALQRRYTVLERFEVFLTPAGEAFIPGPRTMSTRTQAGGLHQILLRIDTSDDRDSRSNIGGLVDQVGGVAGFPLPVVRYFVGSGDSTPTTVRLLAPADGVPLGHSPVFSWRDAAQASFYRLEVQTLTGSQVLVAVITPGIGQYAAPPWLSGQGELRWRIVTLDRGGRSLATTEWRTFAVQ